MKAFLTSLASASILLLGSMPAHAQWAMTCTRDPNSSVNLRNGPSKNNYVIASIPNSQYVRALTWVWGSDGQRWYNVEHNGLVGWMRFDYLCR